MATTTIKISADDDHLERLTDITKTVDTQNGVLLEGNLDLEEHLMAIGVLASKGIELLELAGQMQADVARMVSV